MIGSNSGYFYGFTENGTYKFNLRTISNEVYSEETDDFYLTIKK